MQFSDQEFWDCKELFNDQLKKLADEFSDQLELGKGTKRKYDLILVVFVDYISSYTNHIEIKTILPGNAASRFYYRMNYDYEFDRSITYVKKVILQFFVFLKEEGCTNEKVIL